MLRQPQRGRIIAAGIITFWLVMTGLLLWNELPGLLNSPSVRAPRHTQPQDLWLGVYVDGTRRIGFINARSMPDMRGGMPGTRLGFTARMTMSMFGQETQVQLSGSAWISERDGLRDFDFSLQSGEHTLRVDGEIEAGSLHARLHTAGETLPFNFPVGKEVLLSEGMGLSSLSVPLLEPGQKVQIDAFDPMSMRVAKAQLECVGKETLTLGGQAVETSVITITLSGIASKAWVTADEVVVRAETPFGFTLEKITPEEALAPIALDEKASLVRIMTVKTSGLRPVRDVQRLVLRLSGAPEESLPEVDDTQRRDGHVYTIAAPAGLDPAGPPLPEEARAAALQADAFVQSGHDRIRSAAIAAVGDATDPWVQAQRLNEWLYTNIEKRAAASVPSALEVLQKRQGDCNEHTILFAAMARSLGIPTRIAIGLVWSEELDGFGYHAWPEVYAGRWIWLDPTLGQPIADATHLKLFTGSIEQWPRLLPYLGKLHIEIIEVGAG